MYGLRCKKAPQPTMRSVRRGVASHTYGLWVITLSDICKHNNTHLWLFWQVEWRLEIHPSAVLRRGEGSRMISPTALGELRTLHGNTLIEPSFRNGGAATLFKVEYGGSSPQRRQGACHTRRRAFFKPSIRRQTPAATRLPSPHLPPVQLPQPPSISPPPHVT